jgi:hypothetical protein
MDEVTQQNAALVEQAAAAANSLAEEANGLDAGRQPVQVRQALRTPPRCAAAAFRDMP